MTALDPTVPTAKVYPATPINWAAMAVIITVVVAASGVVSRSSATIQRVAALEETTAPLRAGDFARLDERTRATQADVAWIKAHLQNERARQ